jgi:hypothetical protein
MIDAFTLPYDVYSGRQQTPYGTGVEDPGFMQRTANMALSMPTSLAPRGPAQPGDWLTSTSAKIPTEQDLKTAADAGYAAARSAEMTIPASDVATMSQGLQQNLQTDFGAIPKTAPKTFSILGELANPPTGVNAQANYTGLEAARRGLQAIAGEGGSDGFAAQKVIPQLDSFIDTISPDAATARANYAAAQRSNDLTGNLDRAVTGIGERAEMGAAAANSGTNLDNALRQRVKAFIQSPDNVRGFSDDEIDALKSFVQGPTLQNALRKIGNVMGGGGGLGMLLGGGAGALIGAHFGGEGLAGVGSMALPAVGAAIKSAENSMAKGGLNAIAGMIRQRSPLAQQWQAGAPTIPTIGNAGIVPGAGSAVQGGGVPTLSPQVPMYPRGQLPPLPTTGPIPQGLLAPWA